MQIDIKEITLPFTLSNYFKCSSHHLNFLLIDLKNKAYIMLDGKNIFKGNVDISEKAFPLIAENIGILIDKKDIHIIVNGIRSVLLLSKELEQRRIKINYERKGNVSYIHMNDGTYETMISIDKNGSIKYGERANIFFESKED
jgi:hypothetical protein